MQGVDILAQELKNELMRGISLVPYVTASQTRVSSSTPKALFRINMTAIVELKTS